MAESTEKKVHGGEARGWDWLQKDSPVKIKSAITTKRKTIARRRADITRLEAEIRELEAELAEKTAAA